MSDNSENEVENDNDFLKSSSIIDEMKAKLKHIREVRNRNVKAYIKRNPVQKQKANKRASLNYLKKAYGIDVKDDVVYQTLETDEERDLYLKYLVELEKQDK